jgi:hypothetical protein
MSWFIPVGDGNLSDALVDWIAVGLSPSCFFLLSCVSFLFFSIAPVLRYNTSCCEYGKKKRRKCAALSPSVFQVSR